MDGAALGELWALRRRDVDLLRGSIHVRRALKEHYSMALPPEERGLTFGPTKTHGDRIVSLLRFLRTMLDEHMSLLPGGEDTLVFAMPSGTPVRHGLLYRRRFKPADYAALPAELHGLRFHDLRHTAASLSISQGAHPLLVKQRLGHSSIEITMDRYGHLFPSAEQALCAGLDAAYEASYSPAENVVALDSARP